MHIILSTGPPFMDDYLVIFFVISVRDADVPVPSVGISTKNQRLAFFKTVDGVDPYLLSFFIRVFAFSVVIIFKS